MALRYASPGVQPALCSRTRHVCLVAQRWRCCVRASPRSRGLLTVTSASKQGLTGLGHAIQQGYYEVTIF